ncbi:WD40 repeat domain-containing protein [Candidatus Poribacteria bacterium]|nr:WD40 repeat domain-containing protein [Candidatus Poribacteria bacterium]MYB66272.1 WD40 repeat domain-containing protein [Candidatus Poribacteria bacterium]
MKSLIPMLILINLSTSFVQAEDVKLDYTRWGLPEGVIARIGKGTRTAPIAISPETTRLAIATTIGIWLYDSDTYQEIALLAPHKPPCSSLAFSPDGRTLATGTHDGKIRLWDSETGAGKGTLTGQHTGWVNRLFFTPDGETLISAGAHWRGDRSIHLWDVKTWRHRAKLPLKVVGSAIAISPDGNVIAIGHSNEIGLWDVKTAKQIARVRHKKISFVSVSLLAFSPDGELLAIEDDNDIHLWDTKTQQFRASLIGHESMVSVLKFSPDSKILASTSSWYADQGTSVWLWDTTTGQHITTLLGHKEGVRLFEFSPDNNRLVSTSGDLTIRLWDINTRQLKSSLIGHKAELFSLEFSQDRNTLIARDWDANIHSWDLKTGEYKNVFTGQTYHTTKFAQQEYERLTWYSPAIFSADGKTLYCANADNTIWMCDINTGKLKKKLTGYTFQPYHVVFSPNKQTVANPGLDDTIHLWDMNTSKIKVTLKTDIEDVIPMAFSSDGKILASRGQHNIQLWDVKADTANMASKRSTLKQVMHLISFIQDRAPLRYQRQLANFARTVQNKNIRSEQYRATLKGHTGHVETVSFSPDGKTLAIGGNWNNTTQKYDTTIRLWNFYTAQSEAILTGHTSGIRCLSFSPDGKILASGSHDNTIRLWHISTHEKISILTGHTRVSATVTFSPDGKTLASGGYDNTIRLWDVKPGKHKKTLNGHAGTVFYLTFSPDGDILASVSHDGTILLWDMRKTSE